MIRATADEKRGRDDQGQRNLQDELRSLAGDALHFDFAIERVQVGPYDVEPSAASREFGLHGSSRKAGMKQHFAQVTFGQAVRCLTRNETTFDGALPDPRVIDAPAIVLHFHVNVIAAMIGAEHDAALAGLSRSESAGGKLDAMRNRVPDQVDEGIGNLLDDVIVEFGFAARKIAFDLLLSRLGMNANRGRWQR